VKRQIARRRAHKEVDRNKAAGLHGIVVLASMRVQRIDSVAELTRLAPHWDRLVERSGYRLPFSTFSWSASWWRHLARKRDSVRDRLSVRAIWDDRGELAAVAPFMVTERPARGPVRAQWLGFLGADPGLTEVPGVVCLPDLERPVYSALLDDLQRSGGDWHWIRWSGLEPNGVAAEVIGRYGKLRWSAHVPAYLLPLGPSWKEFRSGLPRNVKESLRKCYNSLARDGHSFTFVVTECADEMPAALDHFFRLHRARAGMSGTVHHPDMFHADNARQFLIDVCQTFANQGARIFALKIGHHIVAMRVGFIVGDTLYMYYSGYDPAWSKYGVMTTVVAESIQYAIAAGIRTVNLSVGNDVSKTRWRPAEVLYGEAIQISPSLSAHAAHTAYRAGRTAQAALAKLSLAARDRFELAQRRPLPERALDHGRLDRRT
jgi:CelD/BcsL family acetyltransferase involved in cellulose biosynthesis